MSGFPKFVSESRGGSGSGSGSASSTSSASASSTSAAAAATSSSPAESVSLSAASPSPAGSAASASSMSSSGSACAPSSSSAAAASSSSAKGPLPPPPPPPLNLCIVINICHYLTPLAKLIILAQPLDSSGGEAEREAFQALQNILSVLDTGKNEPINVFPFLDKFCRYIGTGFSDFEEMDIFLVWDYVIKLITVVIPPLREIFLGRLSLSLDEQAWNSLTTRCIHAQFSQTVPSLEEFVKLSVNQYEKEYYNDIDMYQHKTSLESVKNFNSIILGRSPDILAFAVESGHLPASLRFLDALSKNPSKIKPPTTIKFPASFSLSREGKGASTGSGGDEATINSIYDLAAVVTLEGTNCDVAQAYYRYVNEDQSQWYKGSGATHDLVESSKAIEKNYFHSTDAKKVHPRLLIYTKRGINSVLDHLKDFVTKSGQLRCKGDTTFEAAETPEHYDEAKQYYEDAIAHDESLRVVLQDRLHSLEQIERNQKAQSYENQADLSLGKRRFKEACDLYKLAMRSAVPNSPIYNRIREKEDYMMRIISLEIANHLTEKGEDCLKNGSYVQSRENFAQALKLNPNYIHLQSIIQGIDKLITQQSSAQKVSEANQAMKVGRYKFANQLYLEAVHLVPEREVTLKPVLESLVVLMQGEDALMKQRSGLVALEDKKYAQAISLISEAITLLPPESVVEHAFFLCDRAQVYFEMKDYNTAIADCHTALQLRPELAMAYLRLGSAQFELELFDDALTSYEKAMRSDPTLNDQVKVKIRQVNTAKEVQQRKERELERARIKAEETRKLEEKRAKIERERKEKAEKLAQEQVEKTERAQMKEEERRLKALLLLEESLDIGAAKGSKAKETPKDNKLKLKDKAEKEAQKAVDKERSRAEKEKERERVKAEKEAKIREEQAVKDEELRRQREFAAEMERAAQVLKDAEREKELDRERARLERERIFAEKEKVKAEKKNLEKKKVPDTKKAEPSVPMSPSTPIFPVPVAKLVRPAPTDPDFPTLGGPVPVPPYKKDPTAKAKPPAKWSSLLASGEEEGNKSKPHSPTPTFTILKKPTEEFPPLAEGANADNEFRDILESREQVLSSGELKSLITNRIVEMPGIKLTQSMVNSLGRATPDVVDDSKRFGSDRGRGPTPPVPLSHSTLPPSIPLIGEDSSLSNGASFIGNQSMYSPITPLRGSSGHGNTLSNLGSLHGIGSNSLEPSDSLLNSTTTSFPPLASLSRASSSALDQGLGSLGTSFGDMSSGGTSALPLDSNNGGGLFEGFGAPSFSRNVSATLGLEDSRNSSRLSSFFGQSDLGLNASNDVLGGSIFGGPVTSNDKDPLGGVLSLGHDNFGFGNYSSMGSNSLGGSALGSSSLSGGLGASLGGDLFGSSLGGGLLGGVNNAESRLDKLLGSFGDSSDPFSKFSFSSSTAETSSTSLWADPNPLSANAAPFTLSNLSSPPPLKRLDLIELGKKLEEVRVTDTVQYSGLVKIHPFGITLHHWIFDGHEWIENAFFIPEHIAKALRLDDAMAMSELCRRCDFRLTESSVRSGVTKDKFLVVAAKFTNQAIETLSAAVVNLNIASSQSESKWSSLPQSILESRKDFSVADSMIDSLISNSTSSPVFSDKESTTTSPSPPPSVVLPSNVIVATSFSTSTTASTTTAAGLKIKERPTLLKLAPHPTGQVRRYVEIPSELIGLVIGHGGRKIKDLSTDSGSRIQFKTSKTSEREGKPGVLEVQGTAESVDKALQMVWELLQSVGRDYREVTGLQSANTPTGKPVR